MLVHIPKAPLNSTGKCQLVIFGIGLFVCLYVLCDSEMLTFLSMFLLMLLFAAVNFNLIVIQLIPLFFLRTPPKIE